MKKFLVAIFMAAVSATALAAAVQFTWKNATVNVNDGSSIPATGPGSIASTRIEYGTCGSGGSFGTKQGQVVVQGAATTASLPDLTPGVYCARAAHTNTYGVEGPWSNVAARTVSPPTPGAPENFSIGS